MRLFHSLSTSSPVRVFLFFVLIVSAVVTTQPAATAGTLAQFQTSLGTVDVELFDRDKPVTVRNFLRYAQSNVYTNSFMHRWVPGFVIQGGGFRTVNEGGSNVIEAVPQFQTILNEYSVGRTFSNTYGTIAMARASGLTNSATSQWFFNLADNSGLDRIDGGFTVFGRVLRGTNVLNRFNNTSSTNGIYQMQLDPPLSELPVLSPTPTWNDLVYVRVVLLRVALDLNDRGERVISWQSVKDQPNHLEATDNPNEGWETIVTLQGTGERVEFSDITWRGSSRFYRVRIEYP